jgi:WD40 repeat protein
VYGTLKGHTGSVTCLKLLKDGQRLASGSIDKSIRIWNLTSLTLIHTIVNAHLATVNSLDETDNGLLTSSGADRNFSLWNTTTWSKINTFVGAGLSVDWFKNLGMDLFASTTSASGIGIWNMSTGVVQIGAWYSYSGKHHALEKLSNGTLATGTANGLVKIFNYTSTDLVKSFNPFGGSAVYCMKQINYYTLAVGGASGNLVIWNSLFNQTQAVTLSGVLSLLSMAIYRNASISSLVIGTNIGALYYSYFNNSICHPNVSVVAKLQLLPNIGISSLETKSRSN